jgi:peroxiredoxin Q/BCP
MTQAAKSQEAAALAEGMKAPAFHNLPANGGKSLSLSDYAGKYLVLYFYPKDDTPGCTVEALDFTALRGEFSALNAVVVGVSKDSAKSHDKFCEKHQLGVDLLSDADGSLCEAYGTWVEKSMYGKKYMGIDRASFLIGPDGVVKAIWRKVKHVGHAAEVLAVLKKLAA